MTWRPLVLLVLSLALSGCPEPRPASKGKAPGPGAVRVTDDLGREVVLSAPALRVASLSPSNTEILFALGCGGAVVLRDTVSSYPEAVKALPATSPFRLSPEHVAGFSPDLVLLTHADLSRVAALRRVGLTVATYDPRTLKQLHRSVAAIGALCGQPARARELITTLRAQTEAVRAAVAGRPAPLVYVETDGSDPLKPWTAGTDSFVNQVLEAAGGRNLVRSTRPFLQINAEEVFTGNPDFILLMGVERRPGANGLALLRRRPGWKDLAAVKAGRVIDTIHPDLISRPGPRLMQGMQALARALHPGALPQGK